MSQRIKAVSYCILGNVYYYLESKKRELKDDVHSCTHVRTLFTF